MTVYDTAYYVRDDYSLVGISNPFDPNVRLKDTLVTFDDYYQVLNQDKYFEQQVNRRIVHCVKNQTFFCYFVFDKSGILHLFNCRFEVKRFLRSQENFM